MTDMMNVKYVICEESYYCGADRRVSYGVAAYALTNEGSADVIVASVHDISEDKQAVADLVSLCNNLELSVIHLQDAVEDFLIS